MVQSVTKVLTATLVMQLVDEGLVALEDPVHLHLAEFRNADVAASRRVTVRHLLTHTGGFEGDIWAPTSSGGDALERFVVDLVGRARQDFPPGERFSYCNAGFGVLGRLVEVHRGLTYEKALRAYVAEPLGMGELAFSADQALAFRTAIGHVTNAIDATDAAPRPLRHWAVMPPSNPAAGNQLAMSARGLLAFARVHLQDGRSPGGGTVLAEATAQSMRRRQVDHPAVLGPHSHHGLGWWLERGELVEHAGGSTGVTALLRLAPRHDLAAVVLTNSESGGNLIDELLEPLFADLPGVAPPTPQPAMVPTPTHIDIREYIGTYASRQVRATVSRGDDGRLRLDRIALGDSLAMAALAGITVSTGTTSFAAWLTTFSSPQATRRVTRKSSSSDATTAAWPASCSRAAGPSHVPTDRPVASGSGVPRARPRVAEARQRWRAARQASLRRAIVARLENGKGGRQPPSTRLLDDSRFAMCS